MLVQRKGAATGGATAVAALADLQHESIQRGKQRRRQKKTREGEDKKGSSP